MMKKVFRGAMRAGRAMVFTVGVAAVLAMMLGVATTATAADGASFLLGKSNVAKKVSTLVKRGTGAALGLRVGEGQAPLTVNPEAGTATNLSADRLDGRDSADFTSGRGRVLDGTATISNGAANYKLMTLPSLGHVSIDCNSAQNSTTVRYKPATPAEGGDGSSHVVWRNDGSSVVQSYVNYEQPGVELAGGPTEQFVFQVQKYNSRATITVSTHSPSNNGTCQVMAQALMTGTS